uniref:Uncharacterized protein n=1 Tax=Timema poppense TaxID=170557 RepID=A0A7R9CII6_TIMPO|nr:unnamed protein product [Timema poppensis]
MRREMKSVMVTPLTGIATPRKEPESKFTFNPHLAGYMNGMPPPAQEHRSRVSVEGINARSLRTNVLIAI